MQPHLARQAATGRSGVAAIGVAQEFQRVWTASEGKTSTGTPRWSFVKTDHWVTCYYYFYLWDADSGAWLYQGVRLFPVSAKSWVNGHEWVKRQAARAGIGFTAVGGFAACEDPAALQAICDRLGPGTLNVFTQRWLHRLPMPFGPGDRDAGYWWETSMRQVEVAL